MSSIILSLLLAALNGSEAVTLPGTLIDADGKPVAGAEVWLSEGREDWSIRGAKFSPKGKCRSGQK